MKTLHAIDRLAAEWGLESIDVLFDDDTPAPLPEPIVREKLRVTLQQPMQEELVSPGKGFHTRECLDALGLED